MNKIYKIVWSKVKNTYVVVSEIAKSHSKAVSSRQRKSIAAVMTVLALGFIPGGAYAALDGVKTFVEPGNQNVQIGNGTSLENNNGQNGAVAIGDHAKLMIMSIRKAALPSARTLLSKICGEIRKKISNLARKMRQSGRAASPSARTRMPGPEAP